MNAQTVIAIEMMTAAQAIDFHKPLRCGKGTDAAYRTIRKRVSFLDRDRVIHDDIQKMLSLVADGSIVTAAEKSVGILS